MGPEQRSVLVLPTYNEIENLDRFIRAVRASAPSIHVLVIDDNSPDGTGRVADSLAAELGNMVVIHRTNQRGLGSAYRAGFRHVAAEAFTYVITMDADFSHDPALIPSFIQQLNAGADVVVASNGAVQMGQLVHANASRAGHQRLHHRVSGLRHVCAHGHRD